MNNAREKAAKVLKGEVDYVTDAKESDAAHHEKIDGEDPRQQESFIDVWTLARVPSPVHPQHAAPAAGGEHLRTRVGRDRAKLHHRTEPLANLSVSVSMKPQ